MIEGREVQERERKREAAVMEGSFSKILGTGQGSSRCAGGRERSAGVRQEGRGCRCQARRLGTSGVWEKGRQDVDGRCGKQM